VGTVFVYIVTSYLPLQALNTEAAAERRESLRRAPRTDQMENKQQEAENTREMMLSDKVIIRTYIFIYLYIRYIHTYIYIYLCEYIYIYIYNGPDGNQAAVGGEHNRDDAV